MSIAEFRLPDLGEGLTEAEVVSWAVSVGDTVALNQVIGEVETAKATVQLPSPFAGVVHDLAARPGDTVQVGAPLIRIDSADANQVAPQQNSVLVGYGPAAAPASRRPSQRPSRHPAATAPAAAEPDRSAPGRSAPDRETRTPIRGLRKETAAAMVRSAFTAPHVTEFVTVDVTASMELLDRLRSSPQFADLDLTPLPLVAKAVLIAVRSHPDMNATWDEERQDIVTKHYVHLGIATATERGLLVPTIKDAHTLNLIDLTGAVATAVASARAGTSTPDDLRGGTITITNVGVYGVDTGTPILPPGQAAILALGAITRRPWVVDDVVIPRWVTTLAVSFDHRIVDGEQGSRFLADIASILTDPVSSFTARA